MIDQRRGRSIAMTLDERDAFLALQRTCRVGTAGPTGPHVSPLWFVWDRNDLWLYSLTRSQRWRNIERDPRVSVVVDAGDEYDELRGVQITGVAAMIGEHPRVGEVNEALVEIETMYGAKYMADGVLVHDQRHGWLRVVPSGIVSWDFRKRSGVDR
jgi:Pyridoxamine 5'-phosphate oxidase